MEIYRIFLSAISHDQIHALPSQNKLGLNFIFSKGKNLGTLHSLGNNNINS